MRFTEVVSMGKEYLLLGILIAMLFLFLLIVGYVLVYKWSLGGRKILTIWGVVKIGALFCYLTTVIGVTLLSRHGENVQMSFYVHYRLFSSYKEAWINGSFTEWRNLVLNIIMFVPIGIMLPAIGLYFRKFWYTYIAGFIFSFLLEVLQFISGRGVVESDDILNNTLGTMIGFGLYVLVMFLWKKKQLFIEEDKLHSLWLIILFQIPLLLTCIVFITFAFIYYFQPYGNLASTCINRINMSTVELKKNENYSQVAGTAEIYQVNIASKEDTQKIAEDIFSRLGTKIEKKSTVLYDKTAWYYSMDEQYVLTISYMGQNIDLTNFKAIELKGKSGCSEEEIRSVVKKYGFDIPEIAAFADLGSGNYQFIVKMLEQKDSLINGELNCCYTEDGCLFTIYDNITTYKKNSIVDLISPEEAYKKIEGGEFRSYSSLKKVELNMVELSYELDTKGFYQPVYKFDAVVDGEKTEIIISAMK